MVRLCYQDIANSYMEAKQAACGRQACSVMIMVAYEVDAISSCKMLTQLLRSDNIAYTIRPVLNCDEVVHTYNTFVTEDIKSIFMINCGAVYNIPKLFDLERGGDIRVFILDNHRPYHLANIYSRHSVVVFDDTYDPNGNEEDDQMSIPSDGSDISGGNSSSNSDSDSSSEGDEEEEMYDEELLESDDINAAFDQNDEEAELDDDDQNSQAEETEEVEGSEGGEEVENEEVVEEEGEDIHSDEERSVDEEEEVEGSEGDNEEEGEGEGSEEEGEAEGRTAISSPGKRKKVVKKAKIIQSHEEGEEQGEEEQEEQEDYSTAKRPRTSTTSGTGDISSRHQQYQEDDEEEEEVQIRGRRRRESEQAVRARERKHQLQNYYSQNASYTAPTAVMMVGLLSEQLGSTHLPVEVLWQAVLGVTYQYSAGHIPEPLYTEYCSFLKTQFGDSLRTGNERTQYAVKAASAGEEGNQPVVSVVSSTSSNSSSSIAEEGDLLMVPGSETGQVEEAAEYRFFLHRHWSLYDAMYHSPYVASKLNVWSQQGTLKLQELLARMGMPLQQCRQSYQYMTPSLRSHFAGQMQDESILETYNLINPGVAFKSFYRFNSFRNPIAALDLVHAATALTELYGVAAYSTTLTTSNSSTTTSSNTTTNETTTTTASTSNDTTITSGVTQLASNTHKVSSIDAFYDAYYCLGMRSDELMQKGIQAALDLQRTIVKKAAVMLDGNSTIHRSHRLYYAYLSHNTSSWGPNNTTTSGNTATTGSGSSTSGKAAVGDSAGAAIEHTFGRPMVLAKLGQYIMDIKRNLPKKNGGWTGSALLPFILLSEKQDGTFLVVGISPFANLSGGDEITEEQSSKLYPLTNFRQFFKLAGQLLGATIRNISFDANVVEVRREDVQEFLGALDDSLRKATPRHNSTTATTSTAATGGLA